MDIYVGNLPYAMDDQAVQELFTPHGTVEKAKVIIDYDTGQSKGFAFVTMNDNAEAQTAIDALEGHEINGRPLRVNQAREREGGGGGFRGGGGGGGGFRGKGGGGGGGFRGGKGGGGHRGGKGGGRDRRGGGDYGGGGY